MKPKLIIAGCIGLVLVGFGMGQAVQPKVYDDSVPEVIVKTVTKTETVYVDVPGELPEPCVRAVEALPGLQEDARIMSGAAGDLQLQTQDLQKFSVMREPNGMVDANTAIRESTRVLGDAAIRQMHAIDDIMADYEACQVATD